MPCTRAQCRSITVLQREFVYGPLPTPLHLYPTQPFLCNCFGCAIAESFRSHACAHLLRIHLACQFEGLLCQGIH
jgi:hypothetical protein